MITKDLEHKARLVAETAGLTASPELLDALITMGVYGYEAAIARERAPVTTPSLLQRIHDRSHRAD